jgi:hypothetical protein
VEQVSNLLVRLQHTRVAVTLGRPAVARLSLGQETGHNLMPETGQNGTPRCVDNRLQF